MIITLISTLIKLTLTGSVMALAVLLLRFIFKSKLPRTFIVFLWMLSFAAFVVPVRLPAPAFISGIYSENISPAVNAVSPFKAVSQKKTQKVKMTLPVKPDSIKTAPITKSRDIAAVDPYNVIAAAYGVVSITLMILFLLLYAMTLKRFCCVLPVEDSEVLKNLRKKVRVRRAVSLCLSDKTSVPITVGTIRSKIVLPSDFDLGKKELTEHIYVHELIHVKRQDNAVSLIALFIACLHWFNPIVWLMYSMLCRDLELACDSTAVKIFGYSQRSEYAQSLLIMAGRKRKIQPMFVAAFGKYDIRERVKNVMSTRKISAKILGTCVISLLVIGISFTAMACSKIGGTAPAAESSQSTSQGMPKAMKVSNKKLVDQLSGLDLCVGDNLLFTDSKNISSETLYTFFEYITNKMTGEYGDDYWGKWYINSKWHIPEKVVGNVIKKYFDNANFQPEKLPKCYGYNAKTQMFVNQMDGGFGGARFPKLLKRERVSGDTLRVVIAYYDDKYKIIWDTKTYMIRYNDTGYKYLSIVEN